jgi:simple sugar transport system ATP-binding protein
VIIGEYPLPSGALGVDAVAMTMRFGDFVALDKVELKVRPGSFHALLGENGAGKSTLVKCIMGYYHPTEGEVLVGGREQAIANPKDAHALGLGMVYQHFTLVPAMTVAENLVLARCRSRCRSTPGSPIFRPASGKNAKFSSSFT